ncbi:MAG: aromatic ring-hydroxylating dioxygenase subunit alpha [Comamonas sp.]|nr:aromatic ring-hydroxylating dioxygenase subunit alpha [Comamonas sp.]
MTDLSLQLQSPTATQLPVSSYFDPALFEREMQTLFANGPRYVGSTAAVPEVGDYYALPQENEGRTLVRNAQGQVELVSNVCRHRQAIMLKGQGNLHEQGAAHAGGNIVCPIHRWTYSPSGQLLGAPHFDHDPCKHLNNYRLQSWNGLLFESAGRDIAADLAGMGAAQHLSLEGMRLGHIEMHQCNYNWKTFIEVYLEDYHVAPFHPGLGNFVTCNDLQWQFGTEYSVQTVGVAPSFGRPGSPVYKKWHEVLLAYQGGQLPERGAIWLTYYPHIMVEWYPQVLTVSTLHPLGPQQTMNVVEFYYPEDIALFEPDFIAAQQAAYMETAIEDDEIGERMDAGRRALWQRGDNEVGPYQSPMEDGMEHFHRWYHQRMGLPAGIDGR